MESSMAAIEMAGMVDEYHRLALDGNLPIAGPKRVRVIVLYPLDDELDEAEGLKAAPPRFNCTVS